MEVYSPPISFAKDAAGNDLLDAAGIQCRRRGLSSSGCVLDALGQVRDTYGDSVKSGGAWL
jgi:hypothetical protein